MTARAALWLSSAAIAFTIAQPGYSGDASQASAIRTLLARPALTADPDSLFVSIFTDSASSKALILRNAGPDTLQVRLRARPLNLTGIRIRFDLSNGQDPLSTRSKLVSDLQAKGATVTESFSTTVNSFELSRSDIFWTIDMNAAWGVSELDAIEAWVLAGGALFLVGEGTPSSVAHTGLFGRLGVPIVQTIDDATAGVSSLIDAHAATFGVDSLLLFAPLSQLSMVDPPAAPLFADVTGVRVGAAAEPGAGRIIVHAEDLFANAVIDSADNRRYASQVFEWLAAGVPVPWLTVQTNMATIPPLDSITVNVFFDAVGLAPGLYDAAVEISEPGATAPLVLVPTVLLVNAAPTIAVSDTLLDFGTIFVGDSLQQILSISNVGLDTLTVSGIFTSSPDYIATPTAFIAAPGESVAVDITFAPQVVGPIPGTLTIESDDPGQAMVVVDLNGTGFVPPGVLVLPDSLSALLAAGGTLQTTLSITNDGVADLHFRIRIFGSLAPAVTTVVTGRTHDVRSTMPVDAIRLGALHAAETAGSRPTTGHTLSPVPSAIFLPIVEDFETGDFVNWVDAGGSGTKEVTDQTAAEGSRFSYHEFNSAVGHGDGIYLPLGAIQPGYIGFWVRSSSTTTNDAYVVFRDSAGEEVIWFFAVQTGQFYINLDVGGNMSLPYTADTWFHIELVDIDFLTKVFDYFVDGNLVQAAVPFRNAGIVNNLSRLEIYNFSASGDARWDEFVISTQGPIPWLFVDTITDTLAADSTADINVTFDATGLAGGVYDATIHIETNVPAAPVVLVPAQLVVDTIPTGMTGEGAERLRFALHPNIPNPFNPATIISYDIPRREHVRLAIFTVSGERVRTLVDRPLAQGRFKATWNGHNEHGAPVASGVYFVKLTAGRFVQTTRIVLLR